MAVTPTTELRGIALPALRVTGGYFASRNRYDTAFGDLMLALFTPIGARPMLRAFGSALHLVLFEPNAVENIRKIQYIVSETATRWVPHVQIRDLQMVVKGTVVTLRVTFSLVDDLQQESRFVEFDKSAVARSVASERKSA